MKQWKRFVAALLGSALLAGAFAGCSQQQAEEKQEEQPVTLTISAAASLTDALNELAEEYKKDHENVTLNFSFGGSGALQTQIEEGAPVDVFFSAAESNMDALEEQGLINTDTRKDVLKNEIVLITPKDAQGVATFEEAATKSQKLALGEPESVPAGKYAKEVFTQLGLWEQAQSRAVFASNVREVLSWVEAGEADCGVVYATDAMTSEGVQVVANAPEGGPEVLYPAAVLKDSQNQEAAKEYLDFLTGQAASKVFQKYGFTVLNQQ